MEFSAALLPHMAREGLYFVTYLTNTSGQWWGGGAGVVICLARVADLYMAQLMPLSLTVSCFSKIPIDFLAHPGSRGQRALKRFVCVCACVRACNTS